jgi:predicted  nucleic acid-binding Zn-ribbon protein
LSALGQKVKELENLLKTSQEECDRLNETLAQVQMGYLDAMNDKDQLTHEKREIDKRLRNLESQYEEVN